MPLAEAVVSAAGTGLGRWPPGGAEHSEDQPVCRSRASPQGSLACGLTPEVLRDTWESMVAHDEIGGLLPIKRTIRVLDVNNQSFREQEVRPKENLSQRNVF